MSNSSPLKTLKEAARYLRVSERTMRSMRQRGEIPVVRPSPGTVRFREADLDEHIEKNVEQPRRRFGMRS